VTPRHRPPSQSVRLPRAEYLVALTLVFVALLVGWLCVKVVSQDRDLRSEQARGDALAQQVRSLGGTPVVGPRGATGAAGLIGPSGPSGSSGVSGKPGKDGSEGSPGPSGVPGSPGPSGAPGVPGSPGPAGPTGPAGQDGASGAPGREGADGKDASPPAQQTFHDQDGNTWRCTLTDASDPDNPEYDCTQTNTASTSPTPTDQPSPSDTQSSGLLPLTLLERRRT